MYAFKINKISFQSIVDQPKKKVVITLMDDEKTSLTSMGAWCFKTFPLLNEVTAPPGGFLKGNFIWTAIDQDSTKGIVSMLVIRSKHEPIVDRQTTLERQTNIICDHIKQMMGAGFRSFELQTWKMYGMDDKVNVSPINLIECLLPFAQAQDIEISLNIPVTYVTADIERTYAGHVTIEQTSSDYKPPVEPPKAADMPTALRKAYHIAQERKTVNKKPKKERVARNEVVTGSFHSLGELLKTCHAQD